MNTTALLKYSLICFGFVFCSVYALFQLNPFGGWAWAPSQPEYQLMIVGIYFVLGAMMIYASKDPLQHSLFIWFVIWSSLVHAAIMTFQAIVDPSEHGHFLGDIPALYIAAGLLAYLLKKEQRSL